MIPAYPDYREGGNLPPTRFDLPSPQELSPRQKHHRRRREAGFTLVELMVVIVIIGLLATVVMINVLPSQDRAMAPLLIALIAVPILIQSYAIFAIAYAAAKAWKVPHNIAAPCALIGTSNFFELAVAVAIGLFGLSSGAALATVVGVLVEVPVMLSVVWIVNRSKGWYERGAAVRHNTETRAAE